MSSVVQLREALCALPFEAVDWCSSAPLVLFWKSWSTHTHSIVSYAGYHTDLILVPEFQLYLCLFFYNNLQQSDTLEYEQLTCHHDDMWCTGTMKGM